LELELQIKIDPRNDKIFENFTQFVKSIEAQKLDWEKAHFLFAQYIDLLERNLITDSSIKPGDREREEYKTERNKRHIQRIFYYVKSVGFGHKYIW
jgi:hypothetical protein